MKPDRMTSKDHGNITMYSDQVRASRSCVRALISDQSGSGSDREPGHGHLREPPRWPPQSFLWPEGRTGWCPALRSRHVSLFSCLQYPCRHQGLTS